MNRKAGCILGSKAGTSQLRLAITNTESFLCLPCLWNWKVIKIKNPRWGGESKLHQKHKRLSWKAHFCFCFLTFLCKHGQALDRCWGHRSMQSVRQGYIKPSCWGGLGHGPICAGHCDTIKDRNRSNKIWNTHWSVCSAKHTVGSWPEERKTENIFNGREFQNACNCQKGYPYIFSQSQPKIETRDSRNEKPVEIVLLNINTKRLFLFILFFNDLIFFYRYVNISVADCSIFRKEITLEWFKIHN